MKLGRTLGWRIRFIHRTVGEVWAGRGDSGIDGPSLAPRSPGPGWGALVNGDQYMS